MTGNLQASRSIVDRVWNYCNVLAREILEELKVALDQFAGIVEELEAEEGEQGRAFPM